MLNSIYIKSSQYALLIYCCCMAFALSNKAHAQRAYADKEQHSSKVTLLGIVLSEVKDSSRAIDADHSNYSTLSVNVGVLGLFSANQNLQFTGQKPISTTPIYARFSIATNGALLYLLGGAFLQATNSTDTVGNVYTSGQLLGLLNLFGTDSFFKLPAQGIPHDGIKLTINTTLGIKLTANYYYAFFIIAPTANNVAICSGTTATITITNPQSNFTYALYDNGNLVDSSVTGTLTTPVLTTTKTYQLKAWDHGIYDSGLTPVTVTVNPRPAGTLSAVASVLCQGQPTQLQFNATTGTAPYSLIINGTTYNNIQSGTPFNTSPGATTTTTYSLTKITDHNNCTNP